jgi:electron transfer flavoprotein beta subunit
MNILVCIKQVPDLERIVVAKDDHGMAALAFSGSFAMNRFDEFAVEQAVSIKESMVGVHIDVITVGPERSVQILKRAIGMGCNDGIHLATATDADPGPTAVAAWIAQFAHSRKYDLIFCGVMSEDVMCGQVGPMTAALLDLPYATQVIGMKISRDLAHVSIEREIEGGARELVDIRLPALLALQPGINRPRYPALSNMLRANRNVFETIPTDTLEPVKIQIDPMGLVTPPHARAAQVITGSAFEKAGQMAALLKARALI